MLLRMLLRSEVRNPSSHRRLEGTRICIVVADPCTLSMIGGSNLRGRLVGPLTVWIASKPLLEAPTHGPGFALDAGA